LNDAHKPILENLSDIFPKLFRGVLNSSVTDLPAENLKEVGHAVLILDPDNPDRRDVHDRHGRSAQIDV